MTFCSSCGAQLEGDSHFCAKCGADQTAKAGGAPAVQATAPQAPPPQAAFPQQPAQPYAGIPPQYPSPPSQPYAGMPSQYPPPQGQIPVMMGVPPGTEPAKKNTLLYVIIAAAILYGFYYIGNHDQNQNPGPAPQTQPGGGGGGNQAVVAAQKFDGNYNAVNGQIQVTGGTWSNGSNIAVAAVKLGCEQIDANGQGLAQDTVTLTGPAPPGGTVTLPTFSIGAEAQGAAKVNCKITDAETTN